MKRPIVSLTVLMAVGVTFLGCAYLAFGESDAGWVTLIDGAKGLDNWNRVGNANWRAEGGAIVADKGKDGFLVSKDSYKDFQIRAEFWADHTTNSGVFLRCTDPSAITATIVRAPVRQRPQGCARRGDQVAEGADQGAIGQLPL